MSCFLLLSGIAAATMFMPEKQIDVSETQLRVAFDGDAVLFSDESERIFKAHGLDKFFEHERENENTLLDHVISSFQMYCTDVFTNTQHTMELMHMKIIVWDPSISGLPYLVTYFAGR